MKTYFVTCTQIVGQEAVAPPSGRVRSEPARVNPCFVCVYLICVCVNPCFVWVYFGLTP